MKNSFHFFPLWKRGMKEDLTAFQKAKRLPYLLFGAWDLVLSWQFGQGEIRASKAISV